MATPDPMLVFDRDLVRRRRERAARAWEGASFLKREVAQRLVERLDDVRRRFPVAVDLGCHGGELGVALRSPAGTARGGVETLVSLDLALGFARRAAAHGPAVVADEEALPLRAGSVDLVLSALALHWVNDLPGTLLQIGRALKPDGLFLAALLGGETLWQLRRALAQAESDVEGGLSPRVSPFADLRDAAGLLQRAGFALPVADSEAIEVSYPDALALMRDLRAMAESNAVRERRRGLSRRQTLLRAAAIYAERHGGADGRVVATFDVLYLHGWAPHAAQPKPLPPGTATSRLADALGTTERPAGEKAGG
jgi:SAM-dependent methyltransferase